MLTLENQEQFEGFLKAENNNPEQIVVYFTAPWCGACKKLDHDLIQKSVPSTIVWYTCDVDQNDYTLGYCGLKKMPSFVVIEKSKVLTKFTTSDTNTVIKTLNELF
jgi:thioredoxin-like negative regulator of GroEL